MKIVIFLVAVSAANVFARRDLSDEIIPEPVLRMIDNGRVLEVSVDYRGITEFEFHANINKHLPGATEGTMRFHLKAANNGQWKGTFNATQYNLAQGDKLHYWTRVTVKRDVYFGKTRIFKVPAPGQ